MAQRIREFGGSRGRILKYGLATVIPILLFLLYGFTVGGQPSTGLLVSVFAVIFCVLAVWERKDLKTSIFGKIGKAIIVWMIVVVLSTGLYFTANRLKATLVRTYDATVTQVICERFSDDAAVYFQDPTGEEQFAAGDDRIEQGDVVSVAEYNGLFDIDYCVLLR